MLPWAMVVTAWNPQNREPTDFVAKSGRFPGEYPVVFQSPAVQKPNPWGPAKMGEIYADMLKNLYISRYFGWMSRDDSTVRLEYLCQCPSLLRWGLPCDTAGRPGSAEGLGGQ